MYIVTRGRGEKGVSVPRMRRAVVLALLPLPLAACGDSQQSDASARHPPGCPAALSRALGPTARAHVLSKQPSLVACRFATKHAQVDITFDDMPQAWFRWRRAQVERTQTSVEWSRTPGDRPQAVARVGAGAFWVSGPRQLVASDGRRLLTITVRRPRDPAAARRLATRIAPGGLGPSRVPVQTGP